MSERKTRALRDKLERLIQSTRKIEQEISNALKKSADGDKPAKPVNRRVAKGPRRTKRLKTY
jgi:hypothetical protein